jgi:NAD(P)-dependent dehydrogenase (short-subunit alcohol dehydrogenase family)
MASAKKTVIVTGASQGIGAGVANAFLARGYYVVGTSRSATKSKELIASDQLALIDGDIGRLETAQKVVQATMEKFGSIDAVVANAGIFSIKPFTDYTQEDLRAFVATNLEGLMYITQLAVRQMEAQRSGGSVVCITSSMVKNPIGGVPCALPMMIKGGLEAGMRSLAIEYAKQQIRFNAVAPGAVDTPLHSESPKEFLKSLSPMGLVATVDDIAAAVVYLTEATQITGEVLHVDGGAHNGKW